MNWLKLVIRKNKKIGKAEEKWYGIKNDDIIRVRKQDPIIKETEKKH